ncbi:MAG: 4-oxalocrotonate tautomerase [Pseudomonadota bacterium]
MPLINITLAGASLAPSTIQHLQQETTRLMQSILRKEAALTVVSVTQLPAGAFSANGQTVAAAASMQALITAGTNGAAEKADFIFAAKSLLTVAIGLSAAPIYVALHELPAESWGYDGQTQAARKAGKLIGESA